MLDLFAVEHAHHGTLSARFSGDIDIVGTGLLHCQANKLATPLNAVPVVELVSHIAALHLPELRVPGAPHPFAMLGPLSRRAGEGGRSPKTGPGSEGCGASARAAVATADKAQAIVDLRSDVLGHRRRAARLLPFRAVDHTG